MDEKYIVNCADDEYILFDGRIASKTFSFESDGLEHIISCFPLGKGVPKSVKVNTLSREIYGDISVTRWGSGIYELVFKRDKEEKFKNIEAVLEEKIKQGSITHTATLFIDETEKLMIANSVSNVVYDLGRVLTKPRIDTTVLSNGVLFIVTGQTVKGQFLLIALADENYKLLFLGEADEITFSKRSFTTKKKLCDMIGRIMVEEYSFFEKEKAFKVISRKFEYENERDYVPELVPYLLLEAVMTGDIDKAQTYLSDDLKAEKLKSYLGEFKDIEFPKYSEGKNVVAVIVHDGKDESYAREFQFEVESGAVVNINEIKNGAKLRLKNLFYKMV